MDEEKERVSWKQVQKSSLRLDKLSSDGTELVSNVVVAEDAREVQARQELEEAHNTRLAIPTVKPFGACFCVVCEEEYIESLYTTIYGVCTCIHALYMHIKEIFHWECQGYLHKLTSIYLINNHTLMSDCVWWWCCRYEKLEAEALAGEERFEEIVKKWDATTGKTIPQVKYLNILYTCVLCV